MSKIDIYKRKDFMLKNTYKFIILVAVFIGSLYLFSGDISEETRQEKLETISMGEATYPTMSILLDETEVNQLHGYSNNIDNRMNRETITPLDEDQSLKVRISENEYEIKRVDYILTSINDETIIDTGNIKALDQDETSEDKLAKIKLKTELKEEQEYNLRITLVTNKSKKINYYTRVKRVDESNYQENLEYVTYFHEASHSKDESIYEYLERPDSSLDSLSYVTMYSPLNLVTWDNLKPIIESDIIPTIKEVSKDNASIELKYIVSVDTNTGLDYYYIDEFYRVRYTPSKMYLLDYERTMESVLAGNNEKPDSGDIKLGVTNNEDIELFNNKDSTRFAFVFNRELWCFNQFDNSGIRVFSFRQDESDYNRDIYDEHDLRIINMDEDGNVDFLVYGYMNRGAYEGYVGIVLYRYYNLENRIEELTYIPINNSYQFLKEMIEDFSYVNDLDVFYFHINNNIYGYNLLTRQLEEIVSNISDEEFAFSREDNYIVWEEKDDEGLSGKVIIYDLETASKKEITAENNTTVKLLGTIGTDFIYGIANNSDIITTLEGKEQTPMFKLVIADSKGKTLKEYQEDGYYIMDIEVDSSIITLTRAIKSTEGGVTYMAPATGDNILNNMDIQSPNISLVKEDGDSPLKEMYITSPLFSEEAYQYKETVNTVVTKDTTLRLEREVSYSEQFIVYALGEVKGIYGNAGQAIFEADESRGVVFDLGGRIIWERKLTKAINEIQDSVFNESQNSGDSFKSSATALIKYNFNNVSIGDSGSGYDLLQEHFGESYVNLTGATLEQALYFVSDNRPVIAKINPNYYVVIIGYNRSNINIFDPITGTKQSMSKEQGSGEFEELGNVFISYTNNN